MYVRQPEVDDDGIDLVCFGELDPVSASSGRNDFVTLGAKHLAGDPKEILAKAKELFPGKPVTEVAVTHFHDDHAGAAMGFIEEAITLITTPCNINYFKIVGSYSSSNALRGTKIETINGKRTFTDGTTTVELIDIGKGPHTDEMLIGYIPALKLVFQGDLLNRPADGLPQAGNDTTAHFAKRISELGLEVDTVAGVHGIPGTKKDLESAVAMYEAGRRETAQK